nr:hypothetical protein [Tanacetum cinerariifolium]
MTSFDYRLNPLNPIKECSSCGALYTTDYFCSEGSIGDKIIYDLNKTPDLSQQPPPNCPKCENPIDGHYCQGCALLRKKFIEDMFTYCIENEILQDLLDASEPSNDNTNVVNALQEPFVVKQDLDGNSFTYDSTSNILHDSPNVFNPRLQPPIYSYEFCGNNAYYGHDCSLQFPVIHQPIRKKTCAELLAEEQEANINTQLFQYPVIPQPPQKEISVEFLQEKRIQINSVKNFLRKFNRISFYEMPKVLSLAWETILEIELAFEENHCQPEDILELFQRLHNDVQIIHEKLVVYINTPNWDRPTVCYNNDDDEDCTIAITPILSTKEPDNSQSIRDEHLDTILTTELDEFIKSSVENLDFSDSNDDSTSIDDDSFSIDYIEYVEASPPESKLVSLVMEIVIPKVGGIDDDILLTIKDDILRENC